MRPHTLSRFRIYGVRAAAVLVGVIATGLSTVFASVLAAGTPGVVRNLGQLDAEVRYYATADESHLFFTRDAVVLDFPSLGHVVRMRLDGTRGSTQLRATGRRGYVYHYFLGDDPERWKSDVPVFDTIVYRDAWPGVDLHLVPERGGFRYRCTDAEGAPAEPRLRFEGADRIERTYGRAETISESNGNAGRRSFAHGLADRIEIEISGRIVVDEVVAGDPGSRRLRWIEAGGAAPASEGRSGTPDNPDVVLWSTLIGGFDHDRAHALFVDDDGYSITGGYTRSGNYPATSGSYDPTWNGGYDIHVSKFDPTGSTLVWATFMGGGLEDRAFAVLPDPEGNLVLSGHTYSSNFPTTPGAFDATLGGQRDAYAAKLSGDGSTLLWSTYLGGEQLDRAWDMVVDDQGRPVLAGDTFSSDFPVTPGAHDTSFNALASRSDGFATKIAADGQSLVWSSFLGGSMTDYIKYLDHSPDGGYVFCGGAQSSDFPVTAGAVDETHNGGNDCFVAKFDADGETLVYSTYLGGISSDQGEVIKSDASGNVILTGATLSPDFPTTPGAYDTTPNGNWDAFVCKVSADGDSLIFGTYVGGSGADEPWALEIGFDGSPIFSGYVQSTDFPVTAAAFDLTHNGLQDANLTRLDPTGSSLLYSTYFGGSDLDGGWEMALDPAGNPVLTGPTGSPDFPTTPGVYDTSHNGGRDVFLVRFDLDDTSSVPEVPPATLHLSAGPNPFRDRAEIRLELDRPVFVRVQALDVQGRRVATLTEGFEDAGSVRLSWDGRTERGERLASGIYWIQAEAGSANGRRKIVVIR